MFPDRRSLTLAFLLGAVLVSSARSLRAQELERPPLPDYLQVGISEALERGKNYLMRSQQSTGTWAPSKTHAVGYAALPGLTLLELGVPAKDPSVQRAAQFVRAHIPLVKAPALDNTYEVSLAVLFLDRLGDPRDKGNIQKLIARLIAGQTHTGGWSYKVPLLPREEDTPLILSLVKNIKPMPLQELLGGRLERLDNPFVKNWPRKAEVEEPLEKKSVKIPKQLVDLPVLNEFEKFQSLPKLIDPEKRGQEPAFGTTDNSTTQFGLLALWAGRRHGIPATRTGTLAFMRYHTSQNSDGSWGYPYVHGGGPASKTMINPGLLGLAVGHGLVREMKLVDEPAVDEDPRIHRAFLALSRNIEAPQDRIKDLPMPNLYFLWSVERVAVLYKMHVIGDKDWYRAGAEALVANQDPETGMWEKSEYPGGNDANAAPINTSFALLFLKRANLAEDLSAYLTFSPKNLNDNVVKLMPKQVAAPPPPKPEPKVEEKPVVVGEAKPAPAPTPVVTAPPPQMPPPTLPPTPPPAPSGIAWWIWLLVGFGVLLIIGGVLAVILMSRGGGDADEDDDEDERPRPKKKPKRR
jgi:hypothetical protein